MGTHEGLGGGGGRERETERTICYKTFPNFYIYFLVKNYSFSPCNSPSGKLIPLS